MAGPGVLHQPIVTELFISSITNSQDTVVELITAVFKDTTLVELQSLVNGNSDRDGLDIESSLHLRRFALRDGFPSSNCVGTVVLGARALETCVSVIGFKRNSIFLDEFEGIYHRTSIATVVLVGAVNQSLFGEFDQVTGLDGMKTFQSADGGEGPARAALALVLHLGDSVVLSPVDFFLLGFRADDTFGFGGNLGVSSGLEHGEFFERKVHEFVVAQSVGKVLGVGFSDKDVVLFEYIKTSVLFV